MYIFVLNKNTKHESEIRDAGSVQQGLLISPIIDREIKAVFVVI